MNITAKEIAHLIHGQVDGNDDAKVARPAAIDQAQQGSNHILTHIPNMKNLSIAPNASIIISSGMTFNPQKPVSSHADPSC